MAVITPAQVREHWAAITGTAEDTLLTSFCDRADALMAAFCGLPMPDTGFQTLAAATYTRYYDAPDVLYPRAIRLGLGANVASITSAALDSAGDDTYATAVAAGDLVLDKSMGLLFQKRTSVTPWLESDRGNKVVMVAGWSTSPPNLVLAGAALVQHLFARRKGGLTEQLSQSGQTIGQPEAAKLLPISVREALAPFRCGGSRAG